MGGALKAIEKGFFQSEIRQNAYRLKKEVDSNERVLVGVNKFYEKSEKKQNLLRIDDSLGKKQERVILPIISFDTSVDIIDNLRITVNFTFPETTILKTNFSYNFR